MFNVYLHVIYNNIYTRVSTSANTTDYNTYIFKRDLRSPFIAFVVIGIILYKTLHFLRIYLEAPLLFMMREFKMFINSIVYT